MLSKKKYLLVAIILLYLPLSLSAQWLETTITVGIDPYALVYNASSNKVYCANNWIDNVTVLDGATNSVITTIAVGIEPCTLVYNPTNNKVYCTNRGSGDVTVIDGEADSVITTIAVSGTPRALVYNINNNRSYCAHGYCFVTVID